MNDLVHVKKSSIHGRGLFARKDIPADALLGALEGVPTERDGAYVIWAVDATGSSGLRITNVLRFVNHAKEPNACFCEMELWTLRPIKAGEEITHDYELSGER
jgi:SET domain-containing protein